MTGYGRGAVETPGLKVTVQLRSVNNRFADLRLRLPDELLADEPELRRKILATVRRGRVDLDLRLEKTGEAAIPLTLNRPAVESALSAWKILRDEYGIRGEWDLSALLRVPGVIEASGRSFELDASQRRAVDEALDLALTALDTERRREGERLREDLLGRVTRMIGYVSDVRAMVGTLPAAMHKKLVDRVGQLVSQVALDPGRLAQEVAFLVDRADVTEELVRLDGHLSQAGSLLGHPDGEPVGKRLDFLLQEIGRETNTIASKSADLAISRKALDLKAEAEKIREQIQNLE